LDASSSSPDAELPDEVPDEVPEELPDAEELPDPELGLLSSSRLLSEI